MIFKTTKQIREEQKTNDSMSSPVQNPKNVKSDDLTISATQRKCTCKELTPMLINTDTHKRVCVRCGGVL